MTHSKKGKLPELNDCRQLVTDCMDQMHLLYRPSGAMSLAAHVLEYAAYELARNNSAHSASQLILMAAEMEQVANELRDRLIQPPKRI